MLDVLEVCNVLEGRGGHAGLRGQRLAALGARAPRRKRRARGGAMVCSCEEPALRAAAAASKRATKAPIGVVANLLAADRPQALVEDEGVVIADFFDFLRQQERSGLLREGVAAAAPRSGD